MASFFKIGFLLFGILQVCSSLQFTMDIVTNVNNNPLMWNVAGDFEYARSGRGLALINYLLPKNFNHSNFARTSGVWYIVPTPKTSACARQWDTKDFEDNAEAYNFCRYFFNITTPKTPTTTEPPCDLSASAKFQCTIRAPIMESVTVRYNMGGKAVIRISGGRSQHPVAIHANNVPSDTWMPFKFYLEGRTMLLEAVVNGKGDYILIDKIIIETTEPGDIPQSTARSANQKPARRITTRLTGTGSSTRNAGTSKDFPITASGKRGNLCVAFQSVKIIAILLLLLLCNFCFDSILGNSI